MLKTKIPLRVDHTSTIDHAAEVMTSRGFGGHRRGPCSTAPDNTHGKKWRWHNDHRLFQAEPAGPALPGGFAVEQVEEMPSALSAPLVPDSEPVDTPTGPETRATQHIEDVSEVVVPAPAQQPVKEVVEAKDVAEIKDVAEVKDEPAERPKAPVSPLDIFSWARHVTIPAGCILPAGAEFTKTWKVKHFASGDEYDFDEVRLVHQSGGKMLGDGVNPDIRFKRTEIIENAEVEISMYGLRVPNTPGEEIIEHWRFEDKNGVKYGQPLRLR
jgi:next-to-BRCA1 protein 1